MSKLDKLQNAVTSAYIEKEKADIVHNISATALTKATNAYYEAAQAYRDALRKENGLK